MTPRSALITLSLLANAALGTAWWWRAREAAAAAVPTATTTTVSTVATVSAAAAAAKPDENTWGRLAADADDAEFVARLRAEGFPRRMVRLLVHLRLRQRFAAEFRELTSAEAKIPYWSNRSGSFDLNPEMRAKRRALERKLAEQARALLGAADDSQPGDPGFDDEKRLYGGLASDKIAMLKSIQRDYRELAEQVREAANGLVLPEDREQLAYLDRERRNDIAQLLTPEELEDYDRRNSPAADVVRSRLQYFNASEAEFLALYRLQRDFDQRYGRDHLSGLEVERRRAAEPELLAQIAAALGPERFADYEITTDRNYSSTRYFASDAALPPDAVKSLVTIQREINQRAEKVRADKSLGREQQEAQLGALEKEAVEKVTAIFGPKHFDTYQRGAGAWLTKLAPPAPAPLPLGTR